MLEMRRKILKEIDRNPLQPVSKSYENAIIQQNIPPQVPTFKEIKSTLYRHRSSPLSPRMRTMSMRAPLLYVQSTHARDITTDSMSEWGKE